MNHFDICSLALIFIGAIGFILRRNYFSTAFSFQILFLGLCLLLTRGFYKNQSQESFMTIFFLFFISHIVFLVFVALSFRSLKDSRQKGGK